MHVFALRCHCNRPYANIYNGVLTIESRHGGHVHTNALPLATLLRLLRGSRYALSPEEMQRMLEELDVPQLDLVACEAHAAAADGAEPS